MTAISSSVRRRHSRMQKTLAVSILAMSGLTGRAQNADHAFALQSGDRVVFYGDSITAQRLYTRDVEEFVLTRYPRLSVEFFNAGVPGDTVYGGYTGTTSTRLARDVFPRKPTVVTVMLGMNDPGYVPFDPHIFDVFQSGYKSLLDNLTKSLPQARITLIESSPYDEITHGTEFPGLNATVLRYGEFVRQVAQQRHLPFADFNTTLDSALQSEMASNPSYAALLIPDRIHPSEAAHWLMTEELMRAWHADGEVSHVELDAASGKVASAQNAEVSALKITAGGIAWTALEHALPLPFSPDAPLLQFALQSTDLAAMDREMLQISGLQAKQYTLQIDGKTVADLTSAELAAGVNLALLRTPMLDQARDLDWLEDRKIKLDAARFALEAEMPKTAGAAQAIRTLRDAEEQVTHEQWSKNKPKPHAFALVAK